MEGHWKSEWFRKWMNEFNKKGPSYRKALEKAIIIYSSNDETSSFIQRGISKSCETKLVQMTELCINQNYLEERGCLRKNNNTTVHLILSGRLIYRKGIQGLLEAIVKKNSHREYKVEIYGDGDQRAYLKSSLKKMD